jgi:acetylglutamate synthase
VLSTHALIVKLLRSLGGRKEVEQYLKQFSEIDQRRFAVIKVGGGLLAEDLESLASSLMFLHQVGLTPVVVHGAGPQLAATLAAEGIDAGDYAQRSSARALEVVRRVFRQENLRLVDALEELGARGRPIIGGVFEAELGPEVPIVRVHLEAIDSSIRAGSLPIIASLGETASGQILDLGPDAATVALARQLGPFKVMFLRAAGGLRDECGDLLSAINLAEDYELLMAEPWMTPASRHKLALVHELLAELPRTSSVSITSPELLARELFTHKGSGTLVRRGERVLRHDGVDTVDRGRLAQLLTTAFGRPPVAGLLRVARSSGGSTWRTRTAPAASSRTRGRCRISTNIAVTGEAQGEGIGGSLWQRLARDNPSLYWRARVDNPINPWYFQRADGSYTRGDWTVFWYGVEGFTEIQACVERALAMPATLKAHSLGESE